MFSKECRKEFSLKDTTAKNNKVMLDSEDLRTVMSIPGMTFMGIGRASGEKRAKEVVQQVLGAALKKKVSLENAKAFLYNISASSSLTIEELNEIGFLIHDINTDPNIKIIFGVSYDEDMGEDLKLTLLATGIISQVPQEGVVEIAARPNTNPV